MEKATGHINLQLEDIFCAGCATDMETVLCNAVGILKATVTYATGIINIEYDPDEIEKGQILSIVRKMGFKTRLL